MEKKNIVKLNKEMLKNPNVKIFSKVENGEIYYIVSLDSQEGKKSHNNRVAIAEFKQGNLKNVEQLCRRILISISDDKIDKRFTNTLITRLKEISDTQFTEEGKSIFHSIKDGNIPVEGIEIERKVKIEKLLNYEDLEKRMPQATVDVNRMPEEDIKEIGQEVTERLEVLNGISEADVELYQDSLINFMANKEIDVTNKERILSNYIKNIQKLDKDTILECLKAMENETGSKENKLYPIYLRIQEKRVISKVQQYLIGLKFKEKNPDGRIEKYLQVLQEQKIDDLNGKDIETIINETEKREIGEREEYFNKGRNIDFEMMRYLRQFDGEDEEKNQILEFLKSRASSLRQFGKNDGIKLREFLENTDYKDEERTEQNWYLYQVAKVEKDYLYSKFGSVLEKYNELGKDTELTEKEKKLRKLEKEKAEAKELYRKYAQLDKSGKDPEEKNDE